jgi:hypothetical protein
MIRAKAWVPAGAFDHESWIEMSLPPLRPQVYV